MPGETRVPSDRDIERYILREGVKWFLIGATFVIVPILLLMLTGMSTK